MIMMEKLMPYRWMLCVLIVYAVHMYPFYMYIDNGEEETFIYEFLAAVAVISICSYKFGTEKGKVAGFLMFFLATFIDIIIAFFSFMLVLGRGMRM